MSTSIFKATKSHLAAKSDVSMPVACSEPFLSELTDTSNTTLTLPNMSLWFWIITHLQFTQQQFYSIENSS